MLPDNLGYLFDAPLALSPSSPALYQDDAQVSYAELDARCNRIATGLARLGVVAGDRVALMFSNDVRFIESLLGPMRLGAVTVPLNTRMGGRTCSPLGFCPFLQANGWEPLDGDIPFKQVQHPFPNGFARYGTIAFLRFVPRRNQDGEEARVLLEHEIAGEGARVAAVDGQAAP